MNKNFGQLSLSLSNEFGTANTLMFLPMDAQAALMWIEDYSKSEFSCRSNILLVT